MVKRWIEQPAVTAVIIAMIATATACFYWILSIAIQHWNQPILFHDSLYLIRERNQDNIFQWLLQQHNEHRIVLSKLSTLTEASLGLVPGQSAIFQTLILLVATTAMWFKLCSKILQKKNSVILTGLAGTLLILNPWQYENLIWEFQSPWFVINALLIWGALIITSSNDFKGIKNLPAAITAATLPWLTIATSGQGVAFALAFSSCGWLKSHRTGTIISLSSLCAITANFFILPYSKPNHHPPLQFDFGFFLQIWLGGIWQGLALITALAASILLLMPPAIINKKDLGAAALPGLYSLIFACMITVSRSAFGLEQANASRYITHSLMLGITMILFLAIRIEKLDKPQPPSLAIGGFLVLLTTVGSFPQRFNPQAITFTAAIKEAEATIRMRRTSFICHSKQIALRQQGIKVENFCDSQFENQDTLMKRYLDSRMSTTPTGWHKELLGYSIQNTEGAAKSKGLSHRIDSIGVEKDSVTIRGWAFRKKQKMSADNLDPLFIVAYYDGKPLLAFSAHNPRPDVQKELNLKNDKVGFDAVFPRRYRARALTSIYLSGSKNKMKVWE